MSTDRIMDSIKKLDTGNYVSWKTDMTFYHKFQGLWSPVAGEPENDAADEKALATIGLTIERHQQRHILDCTTVPGRPSTRRRMGSLRRSTMR